MIIHTTQSVAKIVNDKWVILFEYTLLNQTTVSNNTENRFLYPVLFKLWNKVRPTNNGGSSRRRQSAFASPSSLMTLFWFCVNQFYLISWKLINASSKHFDSKLQFNCKETIVVAIKQLLIRQSKLWVNSENIIKSWDRPISFFNVIR